MDQPGEVGFRHQRRIVSGLGQRIANDLFVFRRELDFPLPALDGVFRWWVEGEFSTSGASALATR